MNEDGKSKAYFDDKINQIVEYKLLNETEKLIYTKKFIMNLDDEELFGFFNEEPETFMESLERKIRLGIKAFSIPINIETIKIIINSAYFNIRKLRHLPVSTIHKAICFEGTVVGESQIKSYIKSAEAWCKNCFKKIPIEDLTSDKIQLPICENCKKQTTLEKKLCKYGEVKAIIIQESLEDYIVGLPVEYNCIVKDQFINDVHAGQKIRVIAMRTVVLNSKLLHHPFEIHIYSVDDLGDPKDLIPTPEEASFFRTESIRSDFEQNLIDSFAPDIFCAPKSTIWFVKYSMMLYLATGNNIEGKRQFINMFLCGDPGVAKSSMMKFAISISPRAMYISGNGASEAGLTAIIEKQADGKFMARAGLLPMCNGGFAGIDEMNLMAPEHQNALQEAMENQFITKAKAVKIELAARCGILGAANPVYGKYDFDRSVIDNLKLAIPLLNRFDLKWNVIDKVDTAEDTAVSEHLLGYYANPKEFLSKIPYSKTDMIKFFNFVRTQEPILGPEARKLITEFVNKIRNITKDKHSMPIDKRIIESMSRLCVARAKLLLKKEVDKSDIEFISTLYLTSLETFGIDTKTELVQNKFFDTKEMNQDQTFWKIFDECIDSEGAVDMVQVVEKLACTKAFDEYKAKAYFERMIAKRRLYELKSGKWKKVD